MSPLSRRSAALGLAWGLSAIGLLGCSESAEPEATAMGTNGASEPTAAAPASFDEVVAAVEDRVAVYDGIATGVIALVRVGDETTVVTGGQANLGDDLPMGSDLTFPIASITKPMTAAVVMQLVEEGVLQPDDPVQKWLPELRSIREPVTVEQLLSHRSGVPDNSEAEYRRLELGATGRLLAAAAGRGLDATPGAEGRYSNLGFAALGLVIERVLGRPLAQVLQERVFDPVDMSSSSLGGRPGVQGYSDGEPVDDYYLQLHPAAGSVVATTADVDAFFRALWDGELVDPDVVSDMQESRGPVTLSQYWHPDYGLGLIHYEVSCGVALGHSGRIGGFTNEAWTLQGEERSTVVAVNDETADDIARSVVETALCT